MAICGVSGSLQFKFHEVVLRKILLEFLTALMQNSLADAGLSGTGILIMKDRRQRRMHAIGSASKRVFVEMAKDGEWKVRGKLSC